MIIGLDIGTSSTKAVSFDHSGEVLTQYSITYPILTPQPGYYEQDPEEIYQACITSVREVMREITKKYPNEPLEAISVSSAMHAFIAVDEAGTPLTNSIIWADQRSEGIATALRGTEQGLDLYMQTGTPIHPMSVLCKTMWMKEHDTNTFQQAYKFIGIKEYLFFRLFGTYMIDYSIASTTGLFNIHTLNWHAPALSAAGIKPSHLSEPVSIQHSLNLENAERAAELHVPVGTPFIIGASDGCLANLGVGATHPGIASVTVGTSGAVRVISNKASADHKQRVFSYLLHSQQFVVGGAVNNGGVLRNWFRDTFMTEFAQLPEDINTSQLFDEVISSVNPGSEGLVFLPYLTGERAPHWDAKAKGVYFGIQLQHTKAHFGRAMIEGMLFALYSVALALEETTGPIHTVYASGGLARSRVWVQMLADVFNKPVFVKDTVESSAWGAAMIALEALGIAAEAPKASNTANGDDSYEPNKDHHLIYMKNFQQFERLYEILKDEF
ncbi:gluconokinase [Sphingobacterium sp. lm-10]|uniref:gluconokinase n=1 Tax=Sphingobacterium sp. lm-10 TaxID=2944904 RepID=UPI00202067A2|nr:gluconokinase [Sphingobacterium sp. lm-10]MCL7988738.1 gluconokinase [Sphingobacterium sp. lm-10]